MLVLKLFFTVFIVTWARGFVIEESNSSFCRGISMKKHVQQLVDDFNMTDLERNRQKAVNKSGIIYWEDTCYIYSLVTCKGR